MKSHYRRQDSNPSYTKYKSGALPLDQPTGKKLSEDFVDFSEGIWLRFLFEEAGIEEFHPVLNS